jgi:hypothetical protein
MLASRDGCTTIPQRAEKNGNAGAGACGIELLYSNIRLFKELTYA